MNYIMPVFLADKVLVKITKRLRRHFGDAMHLIGCNPGHISRNQRTSYFLKKNSSKPILSKSPLAKNYPAIQIF